MAAQSGGAGMTIERRPGEPPEELVYRCSEPGCGYAMFDAAYGDVEDHWRSTHCRPSPLDDFGKALSNMGRPR